MIPLRRFLGVVLACAAFSTSFAAQKPNIIFILADDLGYGDLGCYGQKTIKTPQIDRMAAEGMKFTQFYAGSTVCAPSRCVLMTGKHLGHATVRGNAGRTNPVAQMLKDSDVTVAEMLKDAGYKTALIGKWGLGMPGDEGVPTKQGFDYFFGYLSQYHAHNHFPAFLWRNDAKVNLPNEVHAIGDEGAGYATKPVQYADSLFFDEAEKFMEKNRANPFFLYLALVIPHANNERSKELGDGQEVPNYGVYSEEPWHSSFKGQASMIGILDEGVGKVLAKLKQLGIDDNTLVIFSSDNGPHNEGGPSFNPEFFDANGPLTGIKRSLTDGGIRVPFIARWPGKIKAGAVAEHVGYFGDMMATFADVSGGKVPDKVDSISIAPTLLAKGQQGKHDFLYWEFYEKGVSQAVLLNDRWKGIRLQKSSAPIQLFDVKNDIAEQTDLASKYPDLVGRIGTIMRTEREDNEYWKLADAPAANAPAKAKAKTKTKKK